MAARRRGTGPTAPPPALLLDAVVRLWRGAYQTGNDRLRPWNVTLSTYAALRVMAEQPDLNLTQLSRRNFVRPQTMTRIVTQLEKRGWVERQLHPDDERVRPLHVTKAGHTALHAMSREVDKINETVLRVLDVAQVEELGDLLRQIARAVEADLRAGTSEPGR